ncbi:hypothetical protein ACH61_03198 [Rathayibacter tanaceti]|uniref:Uncharacterized protein n=1 Tax=Rathayibacter tanaceti TaxID=1671680 RepID=A0A166H0D9_9MICO|nr:hypothetical protein ACH61_03198 [Rathayibacter tanaceti]
MSCVFSSEVAVLVTVAEMASSTSLAFSLVAMSMVAFVAAAASPEYEVAAAEKEEGIVTTVA